MFHKRPPYHTEKVRVAICEALGNVGTAAATGPLQELAGDETGDLADAAAAAVAEIGRRGS